MEILKPPRITSLEPQHIRVVIHTEYNHSDVIELHGVFPFETVFSIKQRIALHFDGNKTWLPSQQFVAQEVGEGAYKPIEFSWPFASSLADPLHPDRIGVPDVRLYKDGMRLPVFPSIFSGITSERAIAAVAGGARTIHVWNISIVAAAAGFGPTNAITEEMFEGVFQVYFPLIQTREILAFAFMPLNDADRESFAVAKAYRAFVDERLGKIESSISDIVGANPVVLRELRRLRYVLPKHESYSESILELKFYEYAPTNLVPFVRFFPSNPRAAPLVKLAMTPAGTSKIADRKLLEAMLGDTPSMDMGSVLIFKSPIYHPRAPLGTAWTLRIFEDGTAELIIGAPRKDAPLPYLVVDEAIRLLPEFLASTPWSVDQLELVELAAVYEFTSKLEGVRPTPRELKLRLDPFVPLFMEDTVLEGSRAELSLRFKAVSNFVADTDPVMNLITTLFLRTSDASLESVRVHEVIIAAITREFGIPHSEGAVYLQTWISRNADFIMDDKTAMASTNLGCMIDIYNKHPQYTFQLNNVESMIDLRRIMTLMTLFTSKKSSDLRVGSVAESKAAAAAILEMNAAVPAAVPAAATAAPVKKPKLTEAEIMELEALGIAPGDDDEEAAEVGVGAVSEEELRAVVHSTEPAPQFVPKPLAEGEFVAPMADEWFTSRLKSRNDALFGYKGKKLYSRVCQTQQHQPNVMAPETYTRVRTLYGDSVFWVEAPLNEYDLLAAISAVKSVNDRDKAMPGVKKTLAEVIELEKRALRLGFPLKDNRSVVTLPSKAPLVTEQDKTEINELIRLQQLKPLWTVARLGADTTKPNYFICSELWCVRDDLPLIPSQFVGSIAYDGSPKVPNSCAFCGGLMLTTPSSPKPGETVFRRPTAGKGESVAKYIGILGKLHHPDLYPLPCCFTTPSTLEIPPGSAPVPPPFAPLPPLQAPIAEMEATEMEDVAGPAAAPAGPSGPAAPVAGLDESRLQPFSIKRVGGAQNQWYIPKQNVLGRNSEGWIDLEKGSIAVPPRSVNAILGQDPEKYLTAIKGAFAVSQLSYLAAPASAFIRYGLGTNIREPGLNLLNIIAYAKYAIDYALSEDDSMTMQTPAMILETMLETRGNEMARVFLQANFGTLLHEFSTPSQDLPADREIEFLTWWGRIGLVREHQRAYAINYFLAWDNFKNYLRDMREPKELRIWESFFAAPGLLTRSGFIVVTIVYPKGKDAPAIIKCPEFGIPARFQQQKPPILFVVQDAATGLYDPLVFYDGVSKDEKRLLGVLQAETEIFGKLPPSTREPLQAFISQYFDSDIGCGRSAEPVHPWIPVEDTTRIPKLSELLDGIGKSDARAEGLLRDRSNRLVGLIVRWEKTDFFLPCLDDGRVGILPSLIGEDAMRPLPSLDKVIDMIMGKQIVVRDKKIGRLFPGLEPHGLKVRGDMIVALELACGAWLPVEPLSITSEVPHKRFAEMKKKVLRSDFIDVLPWETDIHLLKPFTRKETLEATSEEVLDEAYQHLRISFAKWLNKPEGDPVKSQIEELRKARRRLPLYELQKRLDILLTSVIANPSGPWITQVGEAQTMLLRRDCLQLGETDCKGGCAWSGGRCLIHAVGTPRYVDPERVLIARLVDELLRTFGLAKEILENRVPYLRPLAEDSIIHEGESLIFSTSGRGDELLYEQLGYTGRKPGAYARGLTYPEEVAFDDEDLGPAGLPADWAERLRPAVFGADIARDPRARFETALSTITDRSIDELEHSVGHPLTGSVEDWSELATHLSIDVLLTRVNPATRALGIVEWIKGVGAGAGAAIRKFVILDVNGIPLQRTSDNKLVILEPDLPSSIRMWIEGHD